MKLSENKKKYKGLKPKPQFPQNIDELLRGPAHFPNFGRLPDRTNTEFVRSREFAQLLADPFQDGDERSQTERRLEEVQALNRRVAQQQNIPVQQVNAVNPPAPPPRDEEFFEADEGDDPGWWQRWRGRADAAADIARGLFGRPSAPPPQYRPIHDFRVEPIRRQRQRMLRDVEPTLAEIEDDQGQLALVPPPPYPLDDVSFYPELDPNFRPGRDIHIHPSIRRVTQHPSERPGYRRWRQGALEDARDDQLQLAPYGTPTVIGPQHHEPLS